MEPRQDQLFYDRIEDAIDEVIRATGGRKKIAVELWPAKPARDAHNRLDACLNHERPEKLAPHELVFVAKKGREAGCHALMHYLADECGYDRPKPRNRLQEKASLQEEFIKHVRVMERISKRIESLEIGE